MKRLQDMQKTNYAEIQVMIKVYTTLEVPKYHFLYVMYHLDQLFIVKLFCLCLYVQEFNESQNRTMETMMENLKLEREQSKDQMAELVKAITNTPPPVGE